MDALRRGPGHSSGIEGGGGGEQIHDLHHSQVKACVASPRREGQPPPVSPLPAPTKELEGPPLIPGPALFVQSDRLGVGEVSSSVTQSHPTLRV